MASKLTWIFTTRTGGTSEGPFASLNLSLSVGDDPQRVLENRKRVMEQLQLGADGSVAQAAQEHGHRLLWVEGEHCPRRLAGDGRWQVVGRGDGLLTCRPGQALAVLVADCAPVLLAHPESGWVAAVHAGWRGLAAGIVERAVRSLQRACQGDLAGVSAWVGPCIRACCYQVGAEVARAVGAGARRRGGQWFVDVMEAAVERLAAAGVEPSRIWADGRCTACCGELFFSYRRDGPRSGRMAALILRQEG